VLAPERAVAKERQRERETRTESPLNTESPNCSHIQYPVIAHSKFTRQNPSIGKSHAKNNQSVSHRTWGGAKGGGDDFCAPNERHIKTAYSDRQTHSQIRAPQAHTFADTHPSILCCCNVWQRAVSCTASLSLDHMRFARSPDALQDTATATQSNTLQHLCYSGPLKNGLNSITFGLKRFNNKLFYLFQPGVLRHGHASTCVTLTAPPSPTP